MGSYKYRKKKNRERSDMRRYTCLRRENGQSVQMETYLFSIEYNSEIHQLHKLINLIDKFLDGNLF